MLLNIRYTSVGASRWYIRSTSERVAKSRHIGAACGLVPRKISPDPKG